MRDDLVAEAIDRGVNYFDVAPSYGNAEERLGPALEPYRAQRLPRLQDAASAPKTKPPRSCANRCSACGPTTSTCTSFTR